MKKLAHIIAILLFIFFCFECKSAFVKEIIENEKVDPFAQSEWSSKIEKDTSEMLSSWLSHFNPFAFSNKQYIDLGLNVFQEGEDPSKMTVIPIVCYKIKYQPFMDWNGVSPIQDIMELSVNRTDCYIANKNEIKCLVNHKLVDNKWVSYGWGPLSVKMTDFLSNIYFEKHSKSIIIYLETSAEKKPYLINFIVYKEGEKYLYIDNGGTTSSLISELKEFQNTLKSGGIW